MNRRTALTWINWIFLVPAFLLTRYVNRGLFGSEPLVNGPERNFWLIIGFSLYAIAIGAGLWNMWLMYKKDEHVWRFKRTKKRTKDDNTPYQREISGNYET